MKEEKIFDEEFELIEPEKAAGEKQTETNVWLAYTTDYDYDKRFRSVSKESRLELGKVDDKKTWFYPKNSSERKRVNAFGLTIIKPLTPKELNNWQSYEKALNSFLSNAIALKSEREKVENIINYPKVSYPEISDLRNQLLSAYDTQLEKEKAVYLNAKKDLSSLFAPIIKKALSESSNVAYEKAQESKETASIPKSIKAAEEDAAKSKAKHYSEKQTFYPSGEIKSVIPLYRDDKHGFVKNYDLNGNCTLGTLYYFDYETKDDNYKLFKKNFTEKDWERVFYGNYGRGRSSLITRCFEVYNEQLTLQGYMPLEGVFTIYEQKNHSAVFNFRYGLLDNGFFVNAFTPEKIELKKDDYSCSSNGTLIGAKPEAVNEYNLPLDKNFFSLTEAQSVLTDNPLALLEKKKSVLLNQTVRKIEATPISQHLVENGKSAEVAALDAQLLRPLVEAKLKAQQAQQPKPKQYASEQQKVKPSSNSGNEK